MRRRSAVTGASVIAALALALTACGGGTTAEEPAAEEVASEAPAAEETTAAEGGEITIFLIPSPSAEAIKSFIPQFEEATGITVNVSETPYGEAHQKQLLSYNQKAGAYDIAQFDNTFLAPFCQAQAMTPLDDYIAGSTEYNIGDFSQGQQDYGKCNGETLGLTLSTEPMIQWYRTDIYDELGLTPATTWEEYYANAKAVQEAGYKGQIMGFGPNVSWWWMTLLWSFGGQLYDENLNPTVNTPEAVAATEYLASLLEVSPDGAISATGDDTTSKFLGEDIGAMLNYSGYYGMALDPEINKNVGKFATAPMPKGAADIVHLAGWNIGIPADAPNKDNAWKFLEFVLGQTNSRAYLDSGAAAIGRNSIIQDESLYEQYPYLPQLEIPASITVERYPQLAVWPEMEVAIIDSVTGVLTGQQSAQDALTALNEKLTPILAAEPR